MFIEGTPGDDLLKGTPAADIFEAGEGNDRMIGRGGADEFQGDAGDDYIQVLDLAFGSVDGGSGNDVLHTDGKDLNLDLALLGDKIHGIETVTVHVSRTADRKTQVIKLRLSIYTKTVAAIEAG